MKAIEAPEKIYLEKVYPDNGVLPNGINYNQSPNDIEYVRADAFIEKAERYIRSVADGLDKDDDVEEFINEFKKYMRGE